jgi:hypothetical protein
MVTRLACDFVELNYSLLGLVRKIDGLYKELLGVSK